MKITVFAKKGQSADGRKFTRYIGRLTRKSTGETFSTSIKFRESAGAPAADECPMNIEVEKKDANLVSREYLDKNGDPKVGYTLWVSAWKTSDEKYEDHSLDDF